MVLDHVLGCQVLNADQIVLAHKVSGQLVEHILSLVGDVLMQSCQLKPCFLPAVAPLCFSGELPLEAGQLFEIAAVVTAKDLIPISRPTAAPVEGSGFISTSVQHRATKYLPLGLRDIVAERMRPLTSLEIRHFTLPSFGNCTA